MRPTPSSRSGSRARSLAGLLLGGCLALAAGCVERTITITSEPDGALVYLNDEEVGRTPLTVPFLYYGVYDVRLEHEGFAPLWTKHEAKSPWWETPGPDLVAEAVPQNKSKFNWHFELTPLGPLDTEALVDRARQLRATLQPVNVDPTTQPADGAKR
ncbi:MAG: PEGA domain-containing protein [Planctomycetota bacterium]|nr:PEGA domain-containing protein [Planctomycetota bacterium]